MASGKLGTADLAATTLTTLYTVPASKTTALSVRQTNRTNAQITVRLAMSVTTTPALSEYVEYDTPIPANGVLEATGIVLSATQNVVVYASAAGISANSFGYEE